MTKAQAAPKISYDHGVSDKKLIGETIGAFFDRTVETHRDREALVVLVGWALVSLNWSPAAPHLADLRRDKDLEKFTALKLVLQLALYGAAVAGLVSQAMAVETSSEPP